MDEQPTWPADKLAALRLGRRLVAEVPASGDGRRAFVDVTPRRDPRDGRAEREGWTRSDPARGFRVEHWEYDAARLDGFDYDIGAVRMRAASAEDEAALADLLARWGLSPDRFDYPWAGDDPR